MSICCQSGGRACTKELETGGRPPSPSSTKTSPSPPADIYPLLWMRRTITLSIIARMPATYSQELSPGVSEASPDSAQTLKHGQALTHLYIHPLPKRLRRQQDQQQSSQESCRSSSDIQGELQRASKPTLSCTCGAGNVSRPVCVSRPVFGAEGRLPGVVISCVSLCRPLA